MPVPDAIANDLTMKLVARITLQFNNPNPGNATRQQISRAFHAYLELGMQSKHDAVIRGYLQQQQLGQYVRKADGTQVNYAVAPTAEGAINAFYLPRATTAANIVKDRLIARWAQQQLPNTSVFTLGQQMIMAIQGQVQQDHYRYDISYFYDVRDVYLSFHCYPA